MIEIVDQDQGWNDFQESTRELDLKEVMVGYSKSSGDFGLTELAIVQEFGTRIKVTQKMRGFLGSQGLHLKSTTKFVTIPPRPFMRGSFDNNVDELAKEGARLLGPLLEGKISTDEAYEIWGDSFKAIVQNGVISRTLGLAPNTGFTKERKGSETPLVDTGRLIGGIEVEVDRK